MTEPKTKTTEDEMLADLVGFVLAGRPERLEDRMLAMAPEAFRSGVRETRAALATIAFVERPLSPPTSLRDRLLSTLASRKPRRALVSSSTRSLRRAAIGS